MNRGRARFWGIITGGMTISLLAGMWVGTYPYVVFGGVALVFGVALGNRLPILVWFLSFIAYLWPSLQLPSYNFGLYARWGVLLLAVLLWVIPRAIDWAISSRVVDSLPLVGLLWTAWGIGTIFYSIDPLLSAVKVGAWVVLFLVCFIGIPHLLDYLDTQEIMKGLIGINFIIGISTLVVLFFFPSKAFLGSGMRGIVRNPNGLGAYLTLTVPAVFFFLVVSPRSRWWLWGGLMMNVVLISGSSAKGSIIAASGVWVLLVIIARPLALSWRRIIILMGIISLCVIGTFAVGTVLFGQRFGAEWRVLTPGNLFESRAAWWRADLHYIRQRPIFGYGFGTTAGISGVWQLGPSTGIVREKASSLLAIWEETGLVGLILMGGFLLQLFNRARGLLRYGRDFFPKTEAVAVYALVAIIVTGAGESLVSAWLMAPGSFPAYLFWVAAGLMWALGSDVLSDTSVSATENMERCSSKGSKR